jgi:hypothetical protein
LIENSSRIFCVGTMMLSWPGLGLRLKMSIISASAPQTKRRRPAIVCHSIVSQHQRHSSEDCQGSQEIWGTCAFSRVRMEQRVIVNAAVMGRCFSMLFVVTCINLVRRQPSPNRHTL